MKGRFFVGLLFTIMVSSCTQDLPPVPTASFDFRNEGSGRVVFTSTSTHASQLEWYFGDDADSRSHNQETVTHTYTRSGTFKVSLVAKGEGGNRGVSRDITVSLTGTTSPPQAVISYTPNTGLAAPVEIAFSARNSTGNITGYEWLVGGTVFSTSADANYLFQSSGQYTVTLRAFGPHGQSTATTQLDVGAAAAVKAEFEVSSKTGVAPYNVTFTNRSNGNSYVWNFGDGTTSQTASPQHEFRLPGVYNVILTAISSNGTRDSKVEEIVITPQCVVTDSYNGNTIVHSRGKFGYNSALNLMTSFDNQFYYGESARAEERDRVTWEYNSSNFLQRRTRNLSKPGETYADGQTTYHYDALGRLEREERRYTGRHYSAGDRGNFHYEYDQNHMVTRIRADSTTYSFTNGILNGIQHIPNSTASREHIDGNNYTITGYQINGSGLITRVNYQGGAFRTYEHDSKGQITQMQFSDAARNNKRITEQWQYDGRINPDYMRSRFRGHPFYASLGHGQQQENVSFYRRELVTTSSGASVFEKTVRITYRTSSWPLLLATEHSEFNEKIEYEYQCR